MPIPISDGDHLELVVVGNYNNQVELNNVFHYDVETAAGSTLDEWGSGLYRQLKATWHAVVTSNVFWVKVICKILDDDGNLVNTEDFIVDSASASGTGGVEALPPFVCWTFKFLRADGTMRHGFKRIAGVPEAIVHDGVPDSGALTALANLAEDMEQSIQAADVSPNDGTGALNAASAAHPVVVQRVINGDPIVPVNYNQVYSVVYDRIGSQNSRKFGIGV